MRHTYIILIVSLLTCAVIPVCSVGQKSVSAQTAPAQEAPAPPLNQTAAPSSHQTAAPAKEQTPPSAVLEILRLKADQPLYSIELRNVQLADLFRVIAHDYNLNIVIDSAISGTITASFANISIEEALEAIAEMSSLIIEKKGKVFRISPNVITKTVVLRFVEARKVLESAGTPGQTGSTGVTGLLSEKGKILLGQQQNSLTIIDRPENVKKIEDYLSAVDHKLETRVFKLKYLKADEVTGVAQTTLTTTQTTGAEGTTATTTATTTKQQ